MEKTIITKVYECDSCEKEEPAFITPEKLQELPIGWLRFRLSVELNAVHRRQVSSGGGDHRCTCSIKCMKAVIATDLEDLNAKKVNALNEDAREKEAEGE